MGTQKFVADYVKNHKKNFKKFFVSQFIIEIIEMAIFVFALLKLIDNTEYITVCVVSFIVILNVSLFLNTKRIFGGFKAFINEMNINGKYETALKDFKKTNDQNAFDETLSEIELKIRESSTSI